MISVIVPTYNRASVLYKSIDSIINQTYEDWELIIVDDGSTDGTENAVQKYRDKRIRYIKNNGQIHGPARARNIGIAASKGEYIAFNDSDDEWCRRKLELQLEFLQNQKADVTFCVMHKEQDNSYIPPLTFRACNMERILQGSFTGTPALLGRADCFRNNMFDEKLKCNEDWEIVIRLIEQYKVVFQPMNLVEVATTPNSVSSDNVEAVHSIEYIFGKHKEKYMENRKSYRFIGKKILYQEALLRDEIYRKKYLENKNILSMIVWGMCRVRRYVCAGLILHV